VEQDLRKKAITLYLKGESPKTKKTEVSRLHFSLPAKNEK
jgi:hypothetical protein